MLHKSSPQIWQMPLRGRLFFQLIRMPILLWSVVNIDILMDLIINTEAEIGHRRLFLLV